MVNKDEEMPDLEPPLEPLVQPWEQLPGESDRWFARFTRYRLLGHGRDVSKAYQQECEEEGRTAATQASGSWYRESRDRNWQERAAAWDKYIGSADEAEWERRRQQLRSREWEASELLFKKAMHCLRELELSARMQNIANALKIASELGRKSSELWDDNLNAAIQLLLKYDYEVKDKIKKEGDEQD